ncbi:hypothetical protein EGR_07478 [Echinococcus granulosus]|uniref:Uncharacterized protein n=1 Tax=Echinococcus granulosus TaxID=6210 RepID=W6UAU7_ECHGR|nr:hypothetical protein EGR_07478 [Echinococcus granulosus]EUB57671.1 hypothetical protein EGR_07478 [Echinococcus granulosus]
MELNGKTSIKSKFLRNDTFINTLNHPSCQPFNYSSLYASFHKNIHHAYLNIPKHLLLMISCGSKIS